MVSDKEGSKADGGKREQIRASRRHARKARERLKGSWGTQGPIGTTRMPGDILLAQMAAVTRESTNRQHALSLLLLPPGYRSAYVL